jgi:CBS domain containing-hemolysin-like protein
MTTLLNLHSQIGLGQRQDLLRIQTPSIQHPTLIPTLLAPVTMPFISNVPLASTQLFIPVFNFISTEVLLVAKAFNLSLLDTLMLPRLLLVQLSLLALFLGKAFPKTLGLKDSSAFLLFLLVRMTAFGSKTL